MSPASVSNSKIPPPSASTLFLLFAKIGLTSFGGGVGGWLMRELVTKKQWLSQADFLSGMALSQALPGLNIVNLSIWIGYRLAGRNGAIAASAGMVIPPLICAIFIFMAYDFFSENKQVALIMAGIAAAAIGLSLEMGIRSTLFASKNLTSILIISLIFICIVFLKWSFVFIILVAAPVSIFLSWLRLKNK